MAIDDILKRIERDTEAAVRDLLDAARQEAAAVQSAYAERATQLEAELRQRAEKRAHEEQRRLIVSEHLEIRKALLARKHEILGTLYAAALRRIGGLPKTRYRELVKSLIVDRAVSGREEIVVSSKQRALFTDGFIAELNEAYPGGGGFTLAGEAGDFEWGVVLREGRRVVNLSLEVLFDQLRDRVEPAIAAVLFPPERGREGR